MTTEAPYFVWRRNIPKYPHLNGYVGCTRFDPNKNPHQHGETFEILLETST